MIALMEITIRCRQLAAAGDFFLWAVNDKGRAVEVWEFKPLVFGWHASSYYGTTLEISKLDGVEGVILPPRMALDYLASPGSLRHARLRWSEEVELLQQAAAVCAAALANGWYAPDFRQWQAGQFGWKLQLPDGMRAEYEAILRGAQRAALGDLDAWFGRIIAAIVAENRAVQEAWRRVVEAHPVLPLDAGELLVQRKLRERLPQAQAQEPQVPQVQAQAQEPQGLQGQMQHNGQPQAQAQEPQGLQGQMQHNGQPQEAGALQSWLDEEEWHEAIGWKQDTTPFSTALQLVEPGAELDLVPAAADIDVEADSSWRLRLVLQDKQQSDILIECDLSGQPIDRNRSLPAHWEEHVRPKMAKDARKWLACLPWLEDLNAPGKPLEQLSDDQAWELLSEGSLRLMEIGYSVYLPSWWETVRQLKPKLKAKVKSSVGSSGNPMFGLQQIVQFDWRLAVGQMELSEEEFRQLAEQKRRLVRIHGQWVRLDAAFLQQAEQLMRQKKKNGMSFRDVLELHLLGLEGSADDESAQDAANRDPASMDANDPASMDANANANAELELGSSLSIEVELNGHLSRMIKQLNHISGLPMIEPSQDFQGILRKYQLEGASWLVFLRRFGLGGCLADDMGLGKTIQWITYLLHYRQNETGSAPALLICPTSVLGNWQKELQRFAPALKVHLHYGSQRAKGEDFADVIAGADLVITSYTLALMDEAELSTVRWSSLCLDEAQNIKNAYTKQSGAIRRLKADHRIAMTGTPIENRLTELWSIFDFLNPGYLGSLRAFSQQYVGAIEKKNDAKLIQQVQKLIHPFLLRRVKKDPSIQLDLPDKQESKTYVALTAEQGALYESLIQDLFDRIERLTAMERRGLILATLTKLKQLCDHPALLLKDRSADPGVQRSHKVTRLLEMVQEVQEEQERCLIFTQYVEMGHLLKEIVEKELKQPVQFLHGGTPKTARDQMVARFQQDTSSASDGQCAIFILSLKAGGTGLNLTAANHVFHFDRWWNPAVEDQATDRAHRIGQTRDVQVHKFITLGTLEERIDEMIERKQTLSRQIVGGGENWITELSTNELRDLVELRKEWITG